jgi:hypothetical protein
VIQAGRSSRSRGAQARRKAKGTATSGRG